MGIYRKNKRTKEKAFNHYTAILNELKWQQFGQLIQEWNRGRKLMPEYTLKSAVDRVERENNIKILPVVMEDIKDFIALTLAKGE